MKSRTSRRDFVKAAVAASFAGVASSAEQPVPVPQSSGKAGASSGRTHAGHPASPHQSGYPRLFTGRHLARISCPLGGIGTGGIGLGGRGNLQDWQIFNRPDTGNTPDLTFPSLWVKTGGAAPYSAVLERRYLPPFDTGENGFHSGHVPGLPRLAEARFLASFPLSRIEFDDPDCPVRVALEGFSPFFPLDADASGLPAAILTYEVHNPQPAAVEAAVAWSVSNPVGSGATRANQARQDAGLDGILMTDPQLDRADPLWGSFVLAALPSAAAAVELLPGWYGGDVWSVGPEHFWFDEFSKSGHLGAFAEPALPVGSVLLRQTIPAGATRSFRFLLAWHFPNRTPRRCGWEAPAGKQDAVLGNYYCSRFADAWAAAEYTARNLPWLERNTRAFVNALRRSTLPEAVKDAASTNLATLVSNTSFRIADGSFHGFEGCGDKSGLGFGTCTHVWNYEAATPYLFPSLARSMREISFGYATDAEGHMDFRHKLPLGFEHWGAAAADGQMGQIVKLYLDWVLSGDDAWLRRQWAAAKRAMAFAWQPNGWDERRSGVMDGVQHNTCDVEFYGPNPMCSSWYLAALRAMGRMAEAMGEPAQAAEYNRIFEKGSRWIDANLFNGEFYIQKIRGIPKDKIAPRLQEGMGARDPLHPGFQVGGGCYADQLVGQYMASVAGLGDLLDPGHIRKALESIYRYNLRRNLDRHASVERVYALNDESALIVVDYSNGGRPEVPMPYYSENWTGMEHSDAALMITHGMVTEAVEIVRNIRNRYDGERRNPFDESEYGRHYARAMSSWASIPLLSGFRYDARARRMELAPKVDDSTLRSFWSVPTAWGSFDLSPVSFSLSAASGAVTLKELALAPFPPGAKLRITSGSKPVAHHALSEAANLRIQFVSPVTVDPGRLLKIEA